MKDISRQCLIAFLGIFLRQLFRYVIWYPDLCLGRLLDSCINFAGDTNHNLASWNSLFFWSCPEVYIAPFTPIEPTKEAVGCRCLRERATSPTICMPICQNPTSGPVTPAWHLRVSLAGLYKLESTTCSLGRQFSLVAWILENVFLCQSLEKEASLATIWMSDRILLGGWLCMRARPHSCVVSPVGLWTWWRHTKSVQLPRLFRRIAMA